MNIGDLVEIDSTPWSKKYIGVLVRELTWREMYTFASSTHKAWWVYIPELQDKKAYDEKSLKLINKRGDI